MKKYLTIAAVLIAGAASMMAAGPAMAHVDVGISIGVPGFFPAPVYVEPQPVYVQPQPVYFEPRSVYFQSQPVYVDRDRGEWREREWRARQWQDRHEYRGHRERRDEWHGHDRGEHHDHDD